MTTATSEQDPTRIQFHCPNCNEPFDVEVELVGRKGQCPCGAKFLIPMPEPVTLKEPAPVVMASRPAPVPRKPWPLLVLLALVVLVAGGLGWWKWRGHPKPLTSPTTQVVRHAPKVSYTLDGDAATLRKSLAAALTKIETTTPKDALSKHVDYRLLLSAHEIVRVTGDSAWNHFTASQADAREFLSEFLADQEWMDAYLAVGRVPENDEIGLNALLKIWRADSKSLDFPRYVHLSSAIASAWSRGANAADLQAKENLGKFSCHPAARYAYFKNQHQAGSLHPMFDELKSWELTLVVGQRCDDESLDWYMRNVNIPLQRYVDACWMVRYRGASDFGDHIQGPLFYRPWNGIMSEAENSLLHGGVCGSLSTFGTQAAAAHGIPAYPVGQPGHCAYGVRFSRGHWVGGFGGPDGSASMTIWPGNIHYVNLAELVFADDAGLREALFDAARSRFHLTLGHADVAAAAMADALRHSPKHLDLRKEDIAMRKNGWAAQPDQALAYANDLLDVFGVDSHPAIDLIATFESLFLKPMDEPARLAWFSRIHRAAAKSSYSWAWDIPKNVLAGEYAMVSQPDNREKLLNSAMAGFAATPYFGNVLEWGISEYLEKGQADAFGRAFNASLAAAGSIDEKSLRASYGKIILATEKSRSIGAFQTIAKAAAARFTQDVDNLTIVDKPEGNLVSQNGIIYATNYSWDDPVKHLNVLNEHGGTIHTQSETAPAITVQLPNEVELSGVLAIKSEGNQGRLRKMRMFRSVDGATWLPMAEIADMPRQWKVIPPAGTRARWIKVEAVNDPAEFMHLRNFLIYAKP